MTKPVFCPHVAHQLEGKADNKHNIKIRFVNCTISKTEERALEIVTGLYQFKYEGQEILWGCDI